MSRLLHFCILLTFLLSFNIETRAAQPHPAVKANIALLERLDSIIENHKYYIERKENRIAGLRSALMKAKTPEEKLPFAGQLYEEYLVYDSDSALYYSSLARKLVEVSDPDNIEKKSECLINEVFVYSAVGFFDDAVSKLKQIDTSRLSPALMARFYQASEYVYSIQALFAGDNEKKSRERLDMANAYRDSLLMLRGLSSPETLWVPIATHVETPEKISMSDIRNLKAVVDGADTPSRPNAINAYWLARYYGKIGDDVNMVKYMSKSAIYDAIIENREIAAIQELADWLFRHDDLNRAHNYLQYGSEQAYSYHNRNRLLSLSNIISSVRKAYNEDLQKRDRRLLIIIIVLALLTLSFIISIIYVIIENRRLKRTRQELKMVNDNLLKALKERDDGIKALEESNKALSTANKVKRELLTFGFRLTSDNINALDDYRKKLLRIHKLRKYDDLLPLLTDQNLIKERYADFYSSFDKTILSIFPDFTEEYNRCAPPDARVDGNDVRKTCTLTTRQRIHALRRLGVEKSADIARMLNVSIRTVYNNRNSSRNDSE